MVEVLVLEDGTAGEMSIQQSSGSEELDDAAKTVVAHMRFVPGRINGKPSPMWGRYRITFKLDPDELKP